MVALLGCVAAVGCATYTATTSLAVEPAAYVRLRFARPRDLVVRRPAGDSVPVRAVGALEGRALDRAGDTLRLAVSGAWDRLGRPLYLPIGPEARVVLDSSVAVGARNTSPMRPVYLTVLAVGVGIGVAYFLLLLTLARMDT